MTRRVSPGELTLVAVVTLVVSGYAIARAGQTGIYAAALVGCFALAVFVIGILWPVAALAGVEVSATTERDAIVGDELTVEVAVAGRARRLLIRPLDPPGDWYAAQAPGAGTVLHTAARRGAFRYLRFELRSSSPLGVLSRRRIVTVALASPVLVGPRPIWTRWDRQPTPADVSSERALATSSAHDAVRGVREYAPGDPARLVHWPTSARVGGIVVREHEAPPTSGLALGVVLMGDEHRDDVAAGRAVGLGRAVLAAGGRLLLATVERDGPVIREVDGVLDLQRRLARAVAGLAPRMPGGWPIEVIEA